MLNKMIIIFKDILETFQYLPIGILGGMCIAALKKGYTVVFRKEKFAVDYKRDLLQYLFVVYVIVLLQITIFSREPGSRIGIDLKFLGTWGPSVMLQVYFIENILLFIPFGILLPLCIGKCGSLWKCTVIAALTSIFLELIQLLTKRGYCQLDDVVTNTLGAVLGCLFIRIVSHLKKCRKLRYGLND